MPRKRKVKDKKIEVAGFIGVGLDGEDGHKRITTGESFLVAGGSEKTHAEMTEVLLDVTEALQRRGNVVLCKDELLTLFHDAYAKRVR